MRGWIAGGGRLVIVGGTGGPGTLGSFPDDLLPYRPSATVDVPAASLTAFLGAAPSDAKAMPALAGTLAGGRSLAVVGDRVIAGERPYGSGATTLIGFDPTVEWIAGGTVADTFWRRLLPQRVNAGLALTDDSQLVSAVGQLPSLALPPIGGLFALLAAYILLVGPINYFVLRRLGHREWAWATIPAFIVLFAVGAYAFGASLTRQRGHRQRDRPGARGTRGDGRHGTGLRGDLLAVARYLPGARAGWRAPVASGERRHVRRPTPPDRRWTCSRATRRGCAIWSSDSGPCERSAPRRRWRSR